MCGALHERGNCFVSLCRSEGWGLGAFDAAASGNPVVTTGFGGHLDYLAGTDYLVRFDLVPVDDPAGYPSYAPDQHWAEPDLDHGAELLRHVMAHRDEAAARAAIVGPRAPMALPAASHRRRRSGPSSIPARRVPVVPGQRARARIRGQSPS